MTFNPFIIVATALLRMLSVPVPPAQCQGARAKTWSAVGSAGPFSLWRVRQGYVVMRETRVARVLQVIRVGNGPAIPAFPMPIA